jgi:hypothetical protein
VTPEELEQRESAAAERSMDNEDIDLSIRHCGRCGEQTSDLSQSGMIVDQSHWLCVPCYLDFVITLGKHRKESVFIGFLDHGSDCACSHVKGSDLTCLTVPR